MCAFLVQDGAEVPRQQRSILSQAFPCDPSLRGGGNVENCLKMIIAIHITIL